MNYRFPIERVVECLNELADEQFQRRVWLASSGPEVSSFSEAICGLFDDTGLGDLLDNRQLIPGLIPEIEHSLRQLDQLVVRAARTFQSIAPATLIELPQMREIRCVAAQIIAQIEQEGVA